MSIERDELSPSIKKYLNKNGITDNNMEINYGQKEYQAHGYNRHKGSKYYNAVSVEFNIGSRQFKIVEKLSGRREYHLNVDSFGEYTGNVMYYCRTIKIIKDRLDKFFKEDE